MKKKQLHRNHEVIRKTCYGILCAGTILAAVGGILLPGRILAMQNEAQFNQVSAVPEQYYSEASAAMARNASANLETYERLQLISGKWKSIVSEANPYEMETQDYEAVNTAREELNQMQEISLYPNTLSSEYGNWYTWEATSYKAVDATFHTYTAYFWKIEFHKYDGKESHIVYMLEDGTIFLAMVQYDNTWDSSELLTLREYCREQELNYTIIATNHQLFQGYMLYEKLDTTDMEWMDLVEYTKGDYTYSIVQAKSDHCYLYTVVPH